MDRRHFMAGLGAAALPLAARAQQGKPIRVIVPFTAGGATDVTTRIITEKAAQLLGIGVDNLWLRMRHHGLDRAGMGITPPSKLN